MHVNLIRLLWEKINRNSKEQLSPSLFLSLSKSTCSKTMNRILYARDMLSMCIPLWDRVSNLVFYVGLDNALLQHQYDSWRQQSSKEQHCFQPPLPLKGQDMC